MLLFSVTINSYHLSDITPSQCTCGWSNRGIVHLLQCHDRLDGRSPQRLSFSPSLLFLWKLLRSEMWWVFLSCCGKPWAWASKRGGGLKDISDIPLLERLDRLSRIFKFENMCPVLKPNGKTCEGTTLSWLWNESELWSIKTLNALTSWFVTTFETCIFIMPKPFASQREQKTSESLSTGRANSVQHRIVVQQIKSVSTNHVQNQDVKLFDKTVTFLVMLYETRLHWSRSTCMPDDDSEMKLRWENKKLQSTIDLTGFIPSWFVDTKTPGQFGNPRIEKQTLKEHMMQKNKGRQYSSGWWYSGRTSFEQ